MPRPWTEIAWELERPTAESLAVSKLALSFLPAGEQPATMQRLVDTWRSLFVKGGALVASFRVTGADETAQWFFSRNRFHEYELIAQLLASDAVSSALPDLKATLGAATEYGFEESSPLLLDGLFGRTLALGGCFADFRGSMADAKRLAVEVCRELIGDRYEEFRVDYSEKAWSPWFRAMAWDATWVITDLGQELVTLMCVTDGD